MNYYVDSKSRKSFRSSHFDFESQAGGDSIIYFRESIVTIYISMATTFRQVSLHADLKSFSSFHEI